MAKVDKLMGTRIADRYCIIDEIGAGGMGRVFRAMPFADPSRSVAIKVILRSRKLDSEDLLRFQKEAALMSQLHHQNIICFHELGLFGAASDPVSGLGYGYYIVMEMATGSNLKDSLLTDSRKDIAFFFEVALQVTAALDYTHGKNIIHRDIKPQNIVVGRAWKDQVGVLVKVLDFGVARLAEAMHSSSEAEGRRGPDIAGTPMYMAPEQSGSFAAPIDHRVDLYSLGCVLYEILAGRPVFQGQNRESLIQQHVAAHPEPLRALRPDVPQVIEQIVHKLLTKHPDERYQSAFGLYADLQRAKAKLSTQAGPRPSIAAMPLGLNDRFRAVSAKLDLIGRELELAKLLTSYDELARDRGRSRLTIIRGRAGVGKTRLLAEFRAQLSPRKVRFISVSFSRHENNLPYNALANGFNEYLIRVLKNQSFEAEEIRSKIKTVLGPTAHLVAAVVPGLRPYLDPDLPLPEREILPAEADPESRTDRRSEFQTLAKAFSDFTRCLAADQQPVVFIFDNMNWADAKSIELIDIFFSHNNSQLFYLVVSHRTLDRHDSQEFITFIQKFSKLKRRFTEIELGHLNAPAVADLAGKMLDSRESVSSELSDFLQQRTQGNPLYLVELLRTLVAQELISVIPGTQRWTYDLRSIRTTEIHLNTVDLVLSRTETFSAGEREILEVAAVIGMTFQFELLLLDAEAQPLKVMKALQRAIDEGLVTRTPDMEEFKHLGKSFSFTHIYARQVIYENIDADRRAQTHAAVADKLRAAIKKPSATTIFAIAHHLNQAPRLPGNDARSESVCSLNVQAGQAAKRSKSWQSAQRYFENALQTLQQLPENQLQKYRQIFIQENLAEIATEQRHLVTALSIYRELLATHLNKAAYTSIAFKYSQLLLSGGQLSLARQVLKGIMRKLGIKRPSLRSWSSLGYLLILLRDIWPTAWERSSLHRLLGRTYLNARQQEAQANVKATVSSLSLLRLAQQLYLCERPVVALLYHLRIFAEMHSRKASTEAQIVLRTVGDRAVILGYLGQENKAYRIFALAIDVARQLRLSSVQAALLLQRSLTIDHYKAKYEGVEAVVRASIDALQEHSDRHDIAIGTLYLMQAELLRGNIQALMGHALELSYAVPTRNRLSTRGAFLQLFGLLFENRRELVVRQGESFLKRRQQVGGRNAEIFVFMIQSLVSFVKGEIDRTRIAYAQAMAEFTAGLQRHVLFPFEEDMISLYALIFPEIFLVEHRKILFVDEDPSVMTRRIAQRVARIRGQQRPIPSLLKARLTELHGGRDSKRYYDEALRAAKVDGGSLVELMGYFWFGKLLFRSGQSERQDYILRMHSEAQRLGLQLLAELAEKTMTQLAIPFKSSRQPLPEATPHLGQEPLMSELGIEHLRHISQARPKPESAAAAIKQSLSILQKQYDYKSGLLILNPDTGLPTDPLWQSASAKPLAEVLAYIAPYYSVRATLYLPLSDAPWAIGKIGSSDGYAPEIENDAVGPSILASNNVESDETLTVTEVGELSPDAHAKSLVDASAEQGLERRMNALLPLRYGDLGLGLVFLEELQIPASRSSTHRQDLDQFGAQLAVLVDQQYRVERWPTPSIYAQPATAQYLAGQYHLEDCPWLVLWTHGRMRQNRETAWYLGMNSAPREYLLVYCRLNGPLEVREALGTTLWHHLLTLRSLLVASGRTQLAPIEIREELVRVLLAHDLHSQLDAISLSFTVFNHERHEVRSGHLGPSRPLVLGAENEVTAFSEVVFGLSNGRALRYWEVKAPMLGSQTYILPHDSSKLDAMPPEPFTKSVTLEHSGQARTANFQRLIQQMVPLDQVPRYYVASIMAAEEERPPLPLAAVS